MKHKTTLALLIVLLLLTNTNFRQDKSRDILHFVADPSNVQLYWKDDHGQPIKSLGELKRFVEAKNQKLEFAMNGGMYKPDNSPQGLFIENGVTLAPIDTASGNGNFYLKPNGVFFVTAAGNPVVCVTNKFVNDGQIRFATQSGPMLLIDGEIHPAFKKGSPNLNIRNGVGILPGNKILFAMSKQEINFHDFAEFFKSQGCENALYLDGFVSRAYSPQHNWSQLEGNFGVMIGVVK